MTEAKKPEERDNWAQRLVVWAINAKDVRAWDSISYRFLLEDAHALIRRAQAADRLELEVEHLDATLLAELQTESRIEKEAFAKIGELEAEIERLQERDAALARCDTLVAECEALAANNRGHRVMIVAGLVSWAFVAGGAYLIVSLFLSALGY